MCKEEHKYRQMACIGVWAKYLQIKVGDCVVYSIYNIPSVSSQWTFQGRKATGKTIDRKVHCALFLCAVIVNEFFFDKSLCCRWTRPDGALERSLMAIDHHGEITSWIQIWKAYQIVSPTNSNFGVISTPFSIHFEMLNAASAWAHISQTDVDPRR